METLTRATAYTSMAWRSPKKLRSRQQLKEDGSDLLRQSDHHQQRCP